MAFFTLIRGLLLSLFFTGMICRGDCQSFSTKLYTTADGLTDNFILCIYQDSYGYIWIGTGNGLNRFDGKKFTNFGLKQGLPSAAVDRVYEDQQHRLWLGTRNGIAEMRGDSCYTYPLSDHLPVNFVSGFFEPGPGTLCATTSKGLYTFRQHQWIKTPLYPGYDNESIGHIRVSSQGWYINYRNNTLIRRNPDGHFKKLFQINTPEAWMHSLVLVNDSLYIGNYHGIQKVVGDSLVPLFADSLSRRTVYSLNHSSTGIFWMGTKEEGLLAVSNGKFTAIHVPFNLVSNFLEDREHNIWAACFQGLVKIIPSSFTTVSDKSFATIKNIRYCSIISGNRIMVSGEDGQIHIFSQGRSAADTPVHEQDIQFPQKNDFIDFHTTDDEGNTWISTRNGNLYLISKQGLKNMNSIIKPVNRGVRGLAFNKLSKDFFVCGDSVLLYGNNSRLDTFFSTGSRRFIRMPNYIIISEQTNTALVQTLDGVTFFINNKKEIILLGTNILSGLSYASPDPVIHGFIKIWTVAQGRELRSFSWDGMSPPKQEDIITESDGLPTQYILNIVSDDEGKLWIASTRGLLLMEKNKFGKWTHQDLEIFDTGIPSILSFTRLCLDENKNIWMSLDRELLRFDTRTTSVSIPVVHVMIEKIQFINKPADWISTNDPAAGYRNLPFHPTLNHSNNTITIFFNAIQLTDHSLPEYSYRLMNSDTNWSVAELNNNVSFYQLAPGDYVFEIRARIRGFDWTEPARFSFTILKPWWETWWFRSLAVLFASWLIIFIFRLRLRQLKRKSEISNKLRELEMRALKAQMNPHFIHNALNSIQSLILNNQSSLASHYVSQFARLLRQVLENADKNTITLEKELYSLQLYVELEKLRMNMDVHYLVEKDEDINPARIKIPPLILQPFIENALWHGLSRKTGEKKLLLSIHRDEAWIYFDIRDNGIGRAKAALSTNIFPEGNFSKAVQITNSRLIDFNQTPGTDPVSFKDLYITGEPDGTLVTIRLRIIY